MTVTPGQISRRSDFYFQLASLIAAGVPVIQALEMLQRSVSSSYRRHLERVVARLNQGATFTEAMRSSGRWLPAFDLALVAAGEHSGRLDMTLRSLGEHYRERAATLRRLLSALAYPVFILHLAVLVFPTSYLTGLVLSNGGRAFLLQKAGVLLPLYLVTGLLVMAFQGDRGERWRGLLDRLTRLVPLLGSGRHELALSRLAGALEALLSAGVPIIQAWQIAAEASASSRLKRAVARAVPQMESGVTPAETVRGSGDFPELFQSLYATGEVSGQLDSALGRLQHYYEEQASLKFQALAKWTPKLLFLLIALGIGYQVISFYAAYFNQINQLGL